MTTGGERPPGPQVWLQGVLSSCLTCSLWESRDLSPTTSSTRYGLEIQRPASSARYLELDPNALVVEVDGGIYEEFLYAAETASRIPGRAIDKVATKPVGGAASSSIHHEFWPDEVSLLESGVVDWDRVIGTNQVTDVYLLALAVSRRARLITLDARIPVNLVQSANPQSVVSN